MSQPTVSHDRARSDRILLGVLLGLVVVLVGGLAAVVVWSVSREAPSAAVQDWDEFRPAWESAMAKAGVETTFPARPVPLDELDVAGFTSLEATFTGEEITALATMYTYTYDTPDGPIALVQPRISFPADGRVRVSARLRYQGSSYRVEGSVDAGIADGRIVFEPSSADLEVAGFDVDGARRDQALRAIQDYVEALLTAAPRLSVLTADIVEGAVQVEGAAPQRIRHPSED